LFDKIEFDLKLSNKETGYTGYSLNALRLA